MLNHASFRCDEGTEKKLMRNNKTGILMVKFNFILGIFRIEEIFQEMLWIIFQITFILSFIIFN